MTRPRMQCAKCPWKTTTNPNNIPDGYCEVKHASLIRTIAKPGEIPVGPLRMMACHETKDGKEMPCVGWLVHQLGTGNNVALRLAVFDRRVDANVKTVGPQHERFEDTLPKEEHHEVHRRSKRAVDGAGTRASDQAPSKQEDRDQAGEDGDHHRDDDAGARGLQARSIKDG